MLSTVKIRLYGPCTGSVAINGQNIDCKSVQFEGTAGELMLLKLTIPASEVEIDLEGEVGENLIVVTRKE